MELIPMKGAITTTNLVKDMKSQGSASDNRQYPLPMAASENGNSFNGRSNKIERRRRRANKPPRAYGFNVMDLVTGNTRTLPHGVSIQPNLFVIRNPNNINRGLTNIALLLSSDEQSIKSYRSQRIKNSWRSASTNDSNHRRSENNNEPKTRTEDFMNKKIKEEETGGPPTKTDCDCQDADDHSEKSTSELKDSQKKLHQGSQTVHALMLKKGTEKNQRWATIIKKLEHYLDAHSLLMLRQTCVALYNHKYTLNPRSELFLRGFVGYNSNIVVKQVVPLLAKVLGISEETSLLIDFSQCYNFKDISIVYMLTAQRDFNEHLALNYFRNMHELVLDYCHHLTDKSLEVMLATTLPNLERLSLVGCRNEHMTGAPFVSMLSLDRWPKFVQFNCSFSNIGIEPIQAVASFITRPRATVIQEYFDMKKLSSSTEQLLWMEEGYPICCGKVDLNLESERAFGPAVRSARDSCMVSFMNPKCQLEICGSWGSRMFLDRNGFGQDISAFSMALKMGNTKLCSRLTKRVQNELEKLSRKEYMANDHCLQLLSNRGSEYLVNCPITEQAKTNSIDVWTLPISIAIQNQDIDMFNLLIKRGARVNVWDHCGKSPLYKACEMQADRLFRKLLKLGQAPDPVDEKGLSVLTLSIQNGNVDYLEQLLDSGLSVNRTCPHIRNYMSPLYVACKVKSEKCIRLLLERGADTNWLYHGRISPTLLAYQNDSKWLPIFIQYGAGRMTQRRFVLADVMSCAILNNDIDAVKVLLEAYPDLVDFEHKVWSNPMIQAVRLGRYDVLKLMLDLTSKIAQVDVSMKSVLHVAAEENKTDCIKLLIQCKADPNIQDTLGRTPLYLAVLDDAQEAVAALLQHGSDVNIGDFSIGETPLMAALRTRNEIVASLLVEKSPNIDFMVKDKLGRTACVYCLYFECYEVGHLILSRYTELRLQGSLEEIRWFNAISQERLKSKTTSYRSLKRYVRHYQRVHSHIMTHSSQLLKLPSKGALMQSLRKRILWPTNSTTTK